MAKGDVYNVHGSNEIKPTGSNKASFHKLYASMTAGSAETTFKLQFSDDGGTNYYDVITKTIAANGVETVDMLNELKLKVLCVDNTYCIRLTKSESDATSGLSGMGMENNDIFVLSKKFKAGSNPIPHQNYTPNNWTNINRVLITSYYSNFFDSSNVKAHLYSNQIVNNLMGSDGTDGIHNVKVDGDTGILEVPIRLTQNELNNNDTQAISLDGDATRDIIHRLQGMYV